MHDTSMETGKRFFDTYAGGRHGLTVVDIGAQSVNGSLRSVAPAACRYIGVDFVAGEGVDIVITDPYALPLDDASADMVVCSSCFEHSEFFWLLFNEVLRILKPDGVFYLNVPSNGTFHRFPVDCWRFYPDSGVALENWGRRSGYRPALLESFTSAQKKEVWNDFVAVFLKDEAFVGTHPARIQDNYLHFTNGLRHGSTAFARPALQPEDQQLRLLRRLRRLARWTAYAWFESLPPAWQQRCIDLYHGRGGKAG